MHEEILSNYCAIKTPDVLNCLVCKIPRYVSANQSINCETKESIVSLTQACYWNTDSDSVYDLLSHMHSDAENKDISSEIDTEVETVF